MHIHLSIHPSIHPPIHPSIHLSIYLSLFRGCVHARAPSPKSLALNVQRRGCSAVFDTLRCNCCFIVRRGFRDFT